MQREVFSEFAVQVDAYTQEQAQCLENIIDLKASLHLVLARPLSPHCRPAARPLSSWKWLRYTVWGKTRGW